MAPNKKGVMEEQIFCKICKKVNLTSKSYSGIRHSERHVAPCLAKQSNSTHTRQCQFHINLDGGISNWSYDSKKVREMNAN